MIVYYCDRCKNSVPTKYALEVVSIGVSFVNLLGCSVSPEKWNICRPCKEESRDWFNQIGKYAAAHQPQEGER